LPELVISAITAITASTAEVQLFEIATKQLNVIIKYYLTNLDNTAQQENLKKG